MLVQCCLNGARSPGVHVALPRTPADFAREARRAVDAGAGALHLHPCDAAGVETFDAATVAAVLESVRTACPGVPVGTTTGAWIAGDGDERRHRIGMWTVVPEYVSVNFAERGVAALCDLLHTRGIGIEAGLSTPDDARLLIECGIADHCVRVLIEMEGGTLHKQRETAAAIDAILDDANVAVPRLTHGFDATAWPLLRVALERGHAVRIGLEDTLHMPDGSVAAHNGVLVAEARRLLDQ